jgi:G:T-mismatch repair DNA endonuclease (very short patch repair protein)
MKDTRICRFCGTEFAAKHYNEHLCSDECRRKINHKHSHHWEGRCERCGTGFKTHRKSQRFCSKECFYATRNEVVYKNKCVTCGCDFVVDSDHRRKQTCSRDCQLKFMSNISKSNAGCLSGLVAGRQTQSKRRTTVPEKIGFSILDAIGVKYVPQKIMFDKFCVDAFLPEQNAVVQFDGDYWHGHPERFPEPDKRQRNQISKDKSQDAYFKKCDVRVVRLWECDLKKRPDWCSNHISSSLQLAHLQCPQC